MTEFGKPHHQPRKSSFILARQAWHRDPNHFLAPYLHRNRFFEAVRHSRHRVAPIWPLEPEENSELLKRSFDRDVEAEELALLDDSDAEVAFPAGAINSTTVVEVASPPAQAWLDQLSVSDTPRFWTPEARYYLFTYVETSALPAQGCQPPGLRFLNDGDWITYPGNLMDGYLIHWEVDPWYEDPKPLPQELWYK